MSKPMNIRTSVSHPIRIDELSILNGWLGMSFCAGKKDVGHFSGHVWERDLDADVIAIANWGATTWLNLMEESDIKAVSLEPLILKNTVENFGMKYIHFPIVDASTPTETDEKRWQEEISPFVLSELKLGKKVFVHCRGGLGRTGVIAARILIDAGVSNDANEIMRIVRTARSDAIENRIQEEWIREITKC
jgi:ADP-ribosyl-[dinitrogen reductase] hydrolase